MQLKVFATNPASTVQTDHFIVKTLTAVSGAWSVVDQNLLSGQLQMSDVKKPYFQVVDMYTPLVNASLSASAPLDFRLYPLKENVLPMSTGG